MLSASEILGLAVLLLLAGNETTTNLIGNAVRNLLEQPTELAKVAGRSHARSVAGRRSAALRLPSSAHPSPDRTRSRTGRR